MSSIDLKDTFYSVPVHKKYQSLLDILCRGTFKIFISAKWIWTSDANTYKNFKIDIF